MAFGGVSRHVGGSLARGSECHMLGPCDGGLCLCGECNRHHGHADVCGWSLGGSQCTMGDLYVSEQLEGTCIMGLALTSCGILAGINAKKFS